MNGRETVNGKQAETMSLRGWARHADVSPSYAKRLVDDGKILRMADGRIPVAAADRALAELRSVASPGRLEAAAARRRLRDRAQTAVRELVDDATDASALPDPDPVIVARLDAAYAAFRVPLLPARPGEEARIDMHEADGALAMQPAFDQPAEFLPRTPVEALAYRSELRLAERQLALHTAFRDSIRGAANDPDDLSAVLGAMFGQLRRALEVERGRLVEEVEKLVADGMRKTPESQS
jgi:hypothetical protein